MNSCSGPSDAWYDPPEPTHEEDECSHCGELTLVSVKTGLCGECEEGLHDAAAEAKYDEAKDEGRLRRW